MTALNVEAEIDRLYQGPLGDFVDSRAALAKSVAATGAKADAQRIRKLPKPTIVPWAVNQVFWRSRALYDRVIEAGSRLRSAQVAALQGGKADVNAASEAQRRAVTTAVAAADQLAKNSGATLPRDTLTRTFEALSLAEKSAEHPGRLTKPLQPAGFEALAGIAVHAPTAQIAARAAARAASEKERAAAQKREEATRKKQDAAIKKAEAQLERAKRRMAQAQAALKRTREQSS